MSSALGRRLLARIVGVAVVFAFAGGVWSGDGARAARDMPDWVAHDAAPGWVLVETRDSGRGLVVAPARAVSSCVRIVGSAQERVSAVTVSVRGDLSGCHYPLDLDAEVFTTTIRLQAPLAGREIVSVDRGVLTRATPIPIVVSRRVKPPGLVGLRIDLVRETLKAWDLKLKVVGPTSERAYVVSQRSKRKVRRGDVITVRTTKKRPR